MGVINDEDITIDFIRTFAEKKDGFAALFEGGKYSYNVWWILSDRMEKGVVPISTAEGTSPGERGPALPEVSSLAVTMVDYLHVALSRRNPGFFCRMSESGRGFLGRFRCLYESFIQARNENFIG